MTQATEASLGKIVAHPERLRLTQAGIWSVLPPGDEVAEYDRLAAGYDLLIGNSLYNRIAWGTWASTYAAAARAAIASGSGGRILDCGCGSLVFTADAYRNAAPDTLVLLDRSLPMMIRARRRLPGGNFLQGDALALPFQDGTFGTVMSWGMLHIFGTTSPFLAELERVAAAGAAIAVSSLVRTRRARGNAMLNMLEKRGEIAAPQDEDTVRAAFADRFDLISATSNNSNMLTLVGRRR